MLALTVYNVFLIYITPRAGHSSASGAVTCRLLGKGPDIRIPMSCCEKISGSHWQVAEWGGGGGAIFFLIFAPMLVERRACPGTLVQRKWGFCPYLYSAYNYKYINPKP